MNALPGQRALRSISDRLSVLPSTGLLLPLGLALVACSGPSDVTVVRDVQIIHIGASPAELGAGETTTLTLTVADPSAQGVELMVWPCTDLGTGCLEDQAQPTSDWVQRPLVEGEDATVELVASSLWDSLLVDLPSGDTGGPVIEPALSLWALACRPGLCEPLDLAATQPQTGSADDVALRAFLNDPAGGLAQLPLDGSSLSARSVPITDRPTEERNQNPELRLEDDRALSLAPGEVDTLELGLIDETPDALQLDGFTTVGTLGPARTDVYDPTFTWYAGDVAATGRVYVVVRDGQGGSALWRSDLTVTP